MASLSSIFPVGAGYNAGGTGLSREARKLTFWPEPLVKSAAGFGKTRGQTNLFPTAQVESTIRESILAAHPSIPALFRKLLFPDLTGARPNPTGSGPPH